MSKILETLLSEAVQLMIMGFFVGLMWLMGRTA